MATVLRTWSRAVPAPWADTLARHTPPATRLSRLVLRWHPGYPKRGRPAAEAEVVERWVLYQLVPPAFTPPFFVRPPLGAHGRARGITAQPRFALNVGLLDSVQRQLYRETGWYAQPLWCLQGPNGGHPWRYTRAEQLGATARNLPDQPPAPGELAYQGFDGRTLPALRTRDRFLQWEFLGEFLNRSAAQVDREEAEAMREARRQFWDWSESRIRAEVDAFSRQALARAADELPRPIVDRDDRRRLAPHAPDLGRLREAFIHDQPVY